MISPIVGLKGFVVFTLMNVLSCRKAFTPLYQKNIRRHNIPNTYILWTTQKQISLLVDMVKCYCGRPQSNHWESPGRQDKPFIPFVLRVLSVYGHCTVSIGMPFINSSSVLSYLHLEIPNVKVMLQ